MQERWRRENCRTKGNDFRTPDSELGCSPFQRGSLNPAVGSAFETSRRPVAVNGASYGYH